LATSRFAAQPSLSIQRRKCSRTCRSVGSENAWPRFRSVALKSLSDEVVLYDCAVLVARNASRTEPQQRCFADGCFYSNDHKARFYRTVQFQALRTDDHCRDGRYGAMRPHPRSMAAAMTPRRSHQPAAGQHLPEPFGRNHPDTRQVGCRDGDSRRRHPITDNAGCAVVVSDGKQRGFCRARSLERGAGSPSARVGAAGGALHRSVFRPAARTRRRRRRLCPMNCVFWLRTVASRNWHCLITPVRASRSPEATVICSPTTPIQWWQALVAVVAGRASLAASRDFGGASTSPASFAQTRSKHGLFHGGGPSPRCGRCEFREEPVRGSQPSTTISERYAAVR